jgi:sulfite exporter TauE/SafE
MSAMMHHPAKEKTNILHKKQHEKTARLIEIGILALFIIILYQASNLLNINTTITSDTGSLGAILLIGLAASFSSCIALTGGLLLSISARFAETHPHATHQQKFTPVRFFCGGRLLGYILFGGLTGLLGKVLAPSLVVTGIFKIILALLMIYLGLQILQLLPQKYCSIGKDTWLMQKLQKWTQSHSPFVMSLLGALTYFIPCGFTQSMQLVALTSKSFSSGGLIMGVFALGTLPSLIGIGSASAFAQGHARRFFFSFAGTLSIFLGLLNITSGLSLSGVILPSFAITQEKQLYQEDQQVSIDKNGQQVVSVTVYDSGYSPNEFVIQKGIPTWIYANVPSPLSGCIQQMAIPSFNIQQPINVGSNWVGPFTPTSDFEFMCSMGMYRAKVRVR